MRIFFFIALILLHGCGTPNTQTERQVSEKEALCNEISHRVALKLMQDKQLIPCGFGGGAIDQVRMLALSFDYRKPLTIEDGRELILIAVREFTNAINEDERIRPYLASYPFGPERVEIRIFVQDSKGNSVPSSAADVFSCCEGICKYKRCDSTTQRLGIIFTETFAEAEKKVQEHLLEMQITQ